MGSCPALWDLTFLSLSVGSHPVLGGLISPMGSHPALHIPLPLCGVPRCSAHPILRSCPVPVPCRVRRVPGEGGGCAAADRTDGRTDGRTSERAKRPSRELKIPVGALRKWRCRHRLLQTGVVAAGGGWGHRTRVSPTTPVPSTATPPQNHGAGGASSPPHTPPNHLRWGGGVTPSSACAPRHRHRGHGEGTSGKCEVTNDAPRALIDVTRG